MFGNDKFSSLCAIDISLVPSTLKVVWNCSQFKAWIFLFKFGLGVAVLLLFEVVIEDCELEDLFSVLLDEVLLQAVSNMVEKSTRTSFFMFFTSLRYEFLL